ncbi:MULTISPECIES: hypothetical protein [unclassified Oceanicaulis]|uniref:hypothetical protein n=1 Tax=unclassified Oceanicaulis TaxID=2632123 RepID=UPI0025F61777|nr:MULTISPECIES: hypothetical protein [unclassified Oceanicaulis]|tara:strand:- start:1360 stop:2733 length:1374 start_codon:yes stop_codon:yes gene_type:complete
MSNWPSEQFNPLELTLDPLNPRIEVPENASQADIISAMFEYEEIVELANKIAAEGMLPGERIIVTRENGFVMVLEGNRRVTSCQVLLNPSLIPEAYKRDIIKPTEDVLHDIRNIQADVSPDRHSAERILTIRHTEPGIKKWTPIAKMRRAARLYDLGEPVASIAKMQGASEEAVRRVIREYNLLRMAQETPRLHKAEKALLFDPKLKVNPYLRFWTLAGVMDAFQLSFDAYQVPKTSLDKKTFHPAMRKIVKGFFVPDPKTGKTTYDTRTDQKKILRDIGLAVSSDGATRAEKPTKPANSKAAVTEDKKLDRKPVISPTRKSLKPDLFFESLVCGVEDDTLKQVIHEINKINPYEFPLTSTFLFRALIESTIYYLLSQAGDLPKSKMPGLKGYVNHLIANPHHLPDDRARDVLDGVRSRGELDYLSISAHGQWAHADAGRIVSLANQLRQFIRSVVQ